MSKSNPNGWATVDTSVDEFNERDFELIDRMASEPNVPTLAGQLGAVGRVINRLKRDLDTLGRIRGEYSGARTDHVALNGLIADMEQHTLETVQDIVRCL
jgi:hypothetical protein